MVKDNRLSIRIPTVLREKIQRLADDDHRSLNDKIVMILEAHLARGGK
jgi:hypothetical protein